MEAGGAPDRRHSEEWPGLANRNTGPLVKRGYQISNVLSQVTVQCPGHTCTWGIAGSLHRAHL